MTDVMPISFLKLFSREIEDEDAQEDVQENVCIASQVELECCHVGLRASAFDFVMRADDGPPNQEGHHIGINKEFLESHKQINLIMNRGLGGGHLNVFCQRMLLENTKVTKFPCHAF